MVLFDKIERPVEDIPMNGRVLVQATENVDRVAKKPCDEWVISEVRIVDSGEKEITDGGVVLR